MNVYIILAYFVIVIIEYLYYRFYLVNWKKKLEDSSAIKNIEFNIRNEKQLTKVITDFLNERVELLDKMSYNDWINYNDKNVLLNYHGNKYYLYIYEKNNNKTSSPSNFILRASYQKEFIDLDYNDEVHQLNQRYIVFGMFPVNDKLIDEMYSMNGTINDCNVMDYFWENPFNHRAIKKKAYFKRFTKKINENESVTGIIGMGYEVGDLDYQYSDIYLNYIGIPFFVCINILSLILSLVFYYISGRKSIFRPIMLMVIINIFLMVQSSLTGTITDIQLEQSRMNDINSSTLGVSFLVAVNIFILQNLKQSSNVKFTSLYHQTAFLFCTSLIFLLISMYKTLNFNDVESLRQRRIQNQTFFNISIILNLVIFFNYLLFVSGRLNVFNIQV